MTVRAKLRLGHDTRGGHEHASACGIHGSGYAKGERLKIRGPGAIGKEQQNGHEADRRERSHDQYRLAEPRWAASKRNLPNRMSRTLSGLPGYDHYSWQPDKKEAAHKDTHRGESQLFCAQKAS